MSGSTCWVSVFFFSSRRRHTRCSRDWSSAVCSSDLIDGFSCHRHERVEPAVGPILVPPFPAEEGVALLFRRLAARDRHAERSEEHTSELQSRLHLVCRLLLEKKKKKRTHDY